MYQLNEGLAKILVSRYFLFEGDSGDTLLQDDTGLYHEGCRELLHGGDS